MKVLAVIVTHNRCKLLGRCIDYIQLQIYLPYKILVINNGSSDCTVEMLQGRDITFVTQDNLGSAGGWHCGIKQAMEWGYDAVWLMDDDGFPDTGALAALVPALKDDVACASSVVLREDDPARFVFPFPFLDAAGMPVIMRLPRKMPMLADLHRVASNGVYPFAHLFNGALVSLKAIRQVGNVNPDYFIYGDEVDYFFRLRKAGRVISVLDAIHYHPDVSKRPYNNLKVYYFIKNSLVLNGRYFNAPRIRHVIVIVAVLGRVVRRNGIRFMLSILIGKNSSVFYSAIARGLQGRLGKDLHG